MRTRVKTTAAYNSMAEHWLAGTWKRHTQATDKFGLATDQTSSQ